MIDNIVAEFPSETFLRDEPLSRYTNTKTGGNADLLVFPKTSMAVQELLRYTHENHVPVTIIGNASNLIVRDGGIRGLVVILTQMANIQATGLTVTVDAGASLIETTKVAQQASLTGLEFAAGIPGSVGGAVFMNAGAYGGEISEVVTSAIVLTRAGDLKVLDNEALDFGYRHSSVQDDDEIVISTTFTLTRGNATEIQAQMDNLNAKRAAKQPLDLPSCGSVFKRPVGHYTGQLIQKAGLQGYQLGGAQVSMKHAGFIVNVDHATATDYLELIYHIQAVVFEKFGVKLETEVRIIGESA